MGNSVAGIEGRVTGGMRLHGCQRGLCDPIAVQIVEPSPRFYPQIRKPSILMPTNSKNPMRLPLVDLIPISSVAHYRRPVPMTTGIEHPS